MRVAEEETQKKIRRQAAEPLLVYDLNTKLPMGQILDMSASGMKLMTELPAVPHHVYYCRIPFDHPIDGRTEVFFDAECRWCIPNEQTGWYNSGYALRYPTTDDSEVVRKVIHKWMKAHLEKKYSKYTKNIRKEPRFFDRLFGRKPE